jgi:hypothetical protein
MEQKKYFVTFKNSYEKNGVIGQKFAHTEYVGARNGKVIPIIW